MAGKLKGAIAREHPDGLRLRIAVDTLGDIFQAIAGHESGHAGRVFAILDHAPHFTAGFVDGLALFPYQRPGDVLEVLFEQLLHPEQVASPAQRGGGSPFPKCVLGGLYSLIDVFLYPERDLRDLFTCSGAPNVAEGLTFRN